MNKKIRKLIILARVVEDCFYYIGDYPEIYYHCGVGGGMYYDNQSILLSHRNEGDDYYSLEAILEAMDKMRLLNGK